MHLGHHAGELYGEVGGGAPRHQASGHAFALQAFPEPGERDPSPASRDCLIRPRSHRNRLRADVVVPLRLGVHVTASRLVASVTPPGVEAPVQRASANLDVVRPGDSAIEPQLARHGVPRPQDAAALERPELSRRGRREVILVTLGARGDEPPDEDGARPGVAPALGEPLDRDVERSLRLGKARPGPEVPAKRRDPVLGRHPRVRRPQPILVSRRFPPQPHEPELGLPRPFLVLALDVLGGAIVDECAKRAAPGPRDPRALYEPALVRPDRAGRSP
mmetsp:Transcript_10060/g.45573  ORF Transcript_10060/g.45573 Transcript_10060/m.45573 type:complete len:276 (+) Transcript_10060:3532-4359(+)